MFTTDEVLEIQDLARHTTIADLAERYGVSRWSIRAVLIPGYKEKERLRRRLLRDGEVLICEFCKKPIESHKKCSSCGMLTHPKSDKYLASCGFQHSLAVGELCVGCAEGIGCRCPHDLEEIGKHFGTSRERIRQIEQAAYDKIRNKLEKFLWRLNVVKLVTMLTGKAKNVETVK